MRSFALYIQDVRYSVPTLEFIVAEDEAGARALAQRLLDQSRDHVSITATEDNLPIFVVSRDRTHGSRAVAIE
jgi:hypothetical protein